MVTKTKTDIEKLVDRFNQLVNDRIMDCSLTAGNPSFSDAHRMAARARIDELEWAKTNLEKLANE